MDITVYGKTTCADTIATRETLEQLGQSYTWVDLEAEPARWDEALAANGGVQRVPTVMFGDGGAALVEPTAAELRERLAAS